MSDNIINKEELELIATRIPLSDKWQLVMDGPNGPVYNSLTDTLEAWFQATKEHVDFKLSPLSSKLFAIRIKVVEEENKQYGMYGELRFSQGV
jgi:hypothetical protein